MELKVGYKQTEVGGIPEDWQIMPIGQACRLHNGRAYGLHEWEQSGVPVIRLQNLTGGNDYYFSNLKLADNKYCDHGDLLFMWSATFGPRIWLGERAIYHYHIWKVVPKADVATKAYLFHKFESITEEKKAHSTNGGTMLHFTKSDMEGTLIAVPGVAEQESIANALSDADALIESLDQLIAKKRQIKQGAMQELLTGKRRLPGFSGEWKNYRLGEVIASCSSGATPYRGNPDYYKGTVKWISSGELNYNVIFDSIEHISETAVEKANLKLHPAGTFLMAITGLEAAGTRGSCGIIGSPATTNQSCMAIYPSSKLNTAFLFHYYVFRGDELALKYCQGTKQQSYTAKLVKLLPIDLPPTLEEQTAIASVLSDMDSELAALQSRLAKARQIKQGMTQELLTGRIRLL